jgi:hypothetical protein
MFTKFAIAASLLGAFLVAPMPVATAGADGISKSAQSVEPRSIRAQLQAQCEQLALNYRTTCWGRVEKRAYRICRASQRGSFGWTSWDRRVVMCEPKAYGVSSHWVPWY